MTVDAASGTFLGALDGQDRLAAGSLHYGRVRGRSKPGEDTPWSPWHQAFRTAAQ